MFLQRRRHRRIGILLRRRRVRILTGIGLQACAVSLTSYRVQPDHIQRPPRLRGFERVRSALTYRAARLELAKERHDLSVRPRYRTELYISATVVPLALRLCAGTNAAEIRPPPLRPSSKDRLAIS